MSDFLRVPTGVVAVTLGTAFAQPVRGLWFNQGGSVNVTFTDGTSATFTVVASQRLEGSIKTVNGSGAGTTMLGTQIIGLL